VLLSKAAHRVKGKAAASNTARVIDAGDGDPEGASDHGDRALTTAEDKANNGARGPLRRSCRRPSMGALEALKKEDEPARPPLGESRIARLARDLRGAALGNLGRLPRSRRKARWVTTTLSGRRVGAAKWALLERRASIEESLAFYAERSLSPRLSKARDGKAGSVYRQVKGSESGTATALAAYDRVHGNWSSAASACAAFDLNALATQSLRLCPHRLKGRGNTPAVAQRQG